MTKQIMYIIRFGEAVWDYRVSYVLKRTITYMKYRMEKLRKTITFRKCNSYSNIEFLNEIIPWTLNVFIFILVSKPNLQFENFAFMYRIKFKGNILHIHKKDPDTICIKYNRTFRGSIM